MWLVVVGVLLLALKLMGLGFVAGWSWWLVLLPFALAALWWQIADGAGFTQRAAMRREDERAAKRREAQFDSLGLRPPGRGRGNAPPPPPPEQPPRSDG